MISIFIGIVGSIKTNKTIDYILKNHPNRKVYYSNVPVSDYNGKLPDNWEKLNHLALAELDTNSIFFFDEDLINAENQSTLIDIFIKHREKNMDIYITACHMSEIAKPYIQQIIDTELSDSHVEFDNLPDNSLSQKKIHNESVNGAWEFEIINVSETKYQSLIVNKEDGEDFQYKGILYRWFTNYCINGDNYANVSIPITDRNSKIIEGKAYLFRSYKKPLNMANKLIGNTFEFQGKMKSEMDSLLSLFLDKLPDDLENPYIDIVAGDGLCLIYEHISEPCPVNMVLNDKNLIDLLSLSKEELAFYFY